jgi:hypothetical protein
MRLKVKVMNTAGEKTYCLVVLQDISCDSSANVRDYRERVYCDGEFEFELEKGTYEVSVYKGKLYKAYYNTVALQEKDAGLEIVLEELLDVKGMKLYSFDAHSHVSRDAVLETGNLERASTIMKGEDFNFFFAGSPYDHEVHLQDLNGNFTDKVSYREKFTSVISGVNNSSFILDIGNEIVKCRYGHVFMMNYVQNPPFSKYYDREFDPWLFTKIGEEPAYAISYIHEAIFKEHGENSVAVSAHPTSWWWHDNGEFITNIASTIGFEILAGSIDAMVVMGYGSDRKYYQELWYDALRNGYFLPGVAEIDAFYDTIPVKHLEFKTYTYTDEFRIDSLCSSVREGRNIVSSGPIVTMKVNGQLPGAVLQYSRGEAFEAEIQAFRCREGLLSKIQLIVNGIVFKEFDICQEQFTTNEVISVEEDSFLIAKCYDFAGNTSFTNPVYVRNKPFVNKGYLSCVGINVTKGGSCAEGTYWLDDTSGRIAFEGTISLKMRPSSRLHVEVDGQTKTIRLIELKELQQIFKNLYFGYFNKDRRYFPGEVPAEQFKLARIREILDHVEMDVEF